MIWYLIAILFWALVLLFNEKIIRRDIEKLDKQIEEYEKDLKNTRDLMMNEFSRGMSFIEKVRFISQLEKLDMVAPGTAKAMVEGNINWSEQQESGDER